MRETLHGYLLKLQSFFDLEGYQLLGVAGDRIGHFFLAWGLVVAFKHMFNQRKALIIVSLLIVLKECLDWGVLYLYNDLDLRYLPDTAIDLGISFLALGLGCIAWPPWRRSVNKEAT